MMKIVNTTEEYEGHDKYILLELENTGKTIILKYGGYTNIEYNRKCNEITFDLDAFRDFIDNLIWECLNTDEEEGD